MDQNWMVLLQDQNLIEKVLETNQTSGQYGLVLTEQDAKLILKEHANSLREQKRIEFGDSVIPRIIYEFCDSDYLEQSSYAASIIRLQEIFYMYKNEMQDEITDDELLHLMKEQFEKLKELCWR